MIALAGAGVAGWWAADEPVVATGCVISADLVAALMMLPKTWRDPDSETLSTFVLASLAGATMVGAAPHAVSPRLWQQRPRGAMIFTWLLVPAPRRPTLRGCGSRGDWSLISSTRPAFRTSGLSRSRELITRPVWTVSGSLS